MKLTDVAMTHLETRHFMKRIALLLVGVAMVTGVVAAWGKHLPAPK